MNRTSAGRLRSPIARWRRNCLVFAFLSAAVLQTPALAAQFYTVTDLGTLGGASSFGAALNDNGHAVGYSLDANGDTRAFYWTPGGGMQNLGIVGTGSSRALDINNNDHVVGQTGGKAFRWTSETGMVLIDSANNGSANGLNNSDVAIGSRNVAATQRTIRWSSTNTAANPFPLSNTAGAAINDLGQFVGTSAWGISGYYSNGTTNTSLGAFLPTDLNGDREIVGSVGGVAALLDFDTNMTTLLGKLSPGDLSSNALGINESGTIVGVSGASGAFIADSTLSLTSLTSLLDTGFAGWSILTATDINNAGQIIGVGRFNGVDHAVILNLVPEPNAVVTAIFALATLLSFTGHNRLRRSS